MGARRQLEVKCEVTTVALGFMMVNGLRLETGNDVEQ